MELLLDELWPPADGEYRQRVCLEAVVGRQETEEAVADRLGIARDSVHKHVVRGKKRLREYVVEKFALDGHPKVHRTVTGRRDTLRGQR
jgi:hypothetical protein